MKRGLKPLLTGIVLLVLAVLALPLAFFGSTFLTGQGGKQFLVPGSTEITVTEPGRYYLWNDYETIYEGKSFRRSETVPDGVEIVVGDENGDPIPLITDHSVSRTRNGHSQKSIAHFDLDQPGSVRISVTGGMPERVFSLSQSKIWQTFGMVFGGIALAGVLAVLGLILGVVGIVKLANSGK